MGKWYNILCIFSNKIGCDKLHFEKNRYSDSDIDSNHSNCENNDNDDQTGYNNRVNCDKNLKISLFEKRIKKYNHLFCKKTNNPPTNITADINHYTNIMAAVPRFTTVTILIENHENMLCNSNGANKKYI